MGSDKNTAKTTQTTIVWPDGSPDSVGIRGTFGADAQQWWQETIELRKTAADRYSVDLDLPPGRYEFKFVINNTDWQINAQMYASVDDGSGNTNNVLEVTAATKDRNISNNKKRGGGGSSKASSHTTLSVERAQNQSHGPGRDLDLDHDRDRVHNQEPDPSGHRGQASDSHAAGKDEGDLLKKASEQTPLLGVVGSSKGASNARTSVDTDAELGSRRGSSDEHGSDDDEDSDNGSGRWRTKARRYILCAAAVLAIAALGLAGGMLYS